MRVTLYGMACTIIYWDFPGTPYPQGVPCVKLPAVDPVDISVA